MVQKQTDRSAANSKESSLDDDDLSQRIQHYLALKQDLTDFVLDAEDEIATALEAFSAQQLSRWAKPVLSGLNRTDLAIDMFLSEGRIGDRSVIDWFLQENPAISPQTKAELKQWPSGFNGLFVVRSAAAEGYSLTNWLTDKQYSVCKDSSRPAETMSRLSPGEIVLARVLPLTEDSWIFSGPLTLLGKLGKPKLAVAIGNFKKWFPQQLYGDAPELKEAAWESVQQQYDDFLAFFGTPPLTLSGYELNKKLQAYQAQTSERQLAEAGLDSNKSLQELAKDAGASEEDVTEAMNAIGEESLTAKKLLASEQSLKMVMPEISLPEDLRRAEAVTVFSHPRWGQTFLKDYSRLVELLDQESREANDDQAEALDRLLLKYLEDEQVNADVWGYLAEKYGDRLQPPLKRALANPDFDIEQDLDKALAKRGKPLTPQLPDSASVPVHLHNLFQTALKEVGKGAKQKGEGKKKKASKQKSGFGS